jgi:hypothetical protein
MYGYADRVLLTHKISQVYEKLLLAYLGYGLIFQFLPFKKSGAHNATVWKPNSGKRESFERNSLSLLTEGNIT